MVHWIFILVGLAVGFFFGFTTASQINKGKTIFDYLSGRNRLNRR